MKKRCYNFLFILSFFSIIILIIASIISAVKGREYELWMINDVRTAYGLEEFINSLLYYGGYFSLKIPILGPCFLYQVLFISCYIMKKREKSD